MNEQKWKYTDKQRICGLTKALRKSMRRTAFIYESNGTSPDHP